MSTALVAVATTTGVLFTQPQGLAHPGGARTGSLNVVAADAALAAGGNDGRSDDSRGNRSPLVAGRSRVSGPVAAASVPPASVPLPSGSVPLLPEAGQPPPPAPPEKVVSFQFQLQVNGYYCGPAATRIALTVRGKSPTQDAVAGSLGTTTGGTNSAEDTTRVLNAILGESVYRTHMIPGNAATVAEAEQFRADVVHAVSNGYAVVANILGSAVDVAGGSHSYSRGHYLAVVGYRDDGRTVMVADPAYNNGDGTYWMTTVAFANWMAHRGYSA